MPFRIVDGDDLSKITPLEESFLQFAADHGCVQLKGHSKNPGIRASMYNAMPMEGVLKLIEVMKEFKQIHDKRSHKSLSTCGSQSSIN